MSGSLTCALDLTGTQHFGQKDGGRERADSFDGAGRLMIVGELLVRADLWVMSFSKRAFLALSVAIMRSREERTLGAIPFRRFFCAWSIRESSSRRRTKAWRCATSRVGGCYAAGFRAQTNSAITAASSRSVLFRLPALRA